MLNERETLTGLFFFILLTAGQIEIRTSQIENPLLPKSISVLTFLSKSWQRP